MAAAAGTDSLFALPFAAAVHRLRLGRIVFAPGTWLVTVKHVIGGVMQQQRVVCRCPLRHHRHRVGIDGLRQRRLVFGLVDGGVRRRVDDDVGLPGIQYCGETGRLRQVELGS